MPPRNVGWGRTFTPFFSSRKGNLPLLSADIPQDPVDEAPQRPESLFYRQLDRLVADRRVRDSIHIEDLIDAAPQQIADEGLHLFYRRAGKLVQHGVQLDFPLQGSLDCPGQKSPLPLLQILILCQHLLEYQVGISSPLQNFRQALHHDFSGIDLSHGLFVLLSE